MELDKSEIKSFSFNQKTIQNGFSCTKNKEEKLHRNTKKKSKRRKRKKKKKECW